MPDCFGQVSADSPIFTDRRYVDEIFPEEFDNAVSLGIRRASASDAGVLEADAVRQVGRPMGCCHRVLGHDVHKHVLAQKPGLIVWM